jgi:ferric-dicitrate binding protein FerR (iron transport regulator)
MSRPKDPGDRTADAIDCFMCLTDPEADPRARVRWAAWLGESVENRAAYQAVRETWSQPVPQDVWPSHDEIVGDTYDGEGPIPTQPRRRRLDRRDSAAAGLKGPSLSLVAVSLLAAVVVIAGWQKFRPVGPRPPTATAYRTGRGEIRQVALADGSSIMLAPLSSISITETQSGRSARLDDGEALLSIAHDGKRPFKLLANGGEIDDIGTTFAVTVKPDRVIVTVVEGLVAVSATRPPRRDGCADGLPMSTNRLRTWSPSCHAIPPRISSSPIRRPEPCIIPGRSKRMRSINGWSR